MTLATMSKEEFSRVAVLQDLRDGRLGVGEVAALLGVTRRQVFRLQKDLLAEGPAGLASRKRGKPGSRPSRWCKLLFGFFRSGCLWSMAQGLGYRLLGAAGLGQGFQCHVTLSKNPFVVQFHQHRPDQRLEVASTGTV
jgi:hypothetical protein